MAVMYGQQKATIYYHMSTTNRSFLEMSQFLKDSGIQNNKFMLVLLDPALAKVDPHDPRLNREYKERVLRECLHNPWYFFREVVRIPENGQTRGVRFELSRGNLALIFCLMMNMNIFLEQPRQTGKTISSLCWYLYLFNFGTTNAEMSFLNKKLDDSELNLARLKDIRDLLPSYLVMDSAFAPDGTKLRGKNNVKSMVHPLNGNIIRTVASARSRVAAASLLRGRTTPILYIDEYAFIQYNSTIYTNMVPAFNTAALNAKKHGKPYGMVITTTPGLLTTEEGQEAWTLKEQATPFSERWYDLTPMQIQDIIGSNTNSNFVYLKFNYQQLGKSEEWFKDLCITMRRDWDAIRREVLLEWSKSTENSPFREEDLDTIKGLLKQPISTMLMLNKYEFKIYERINLKYPPLIGVDVSGGFHRDSSAITVVDSYTTRVTAEMNSNFISTPELAVVIYRIVKDFMPNAVVNIERNGGFGANVISRLLQTDIKKNLWYTIKDRVIEERIANTGAVNRRTQKTKVYGSDSTHAERERLMEILRNRVEYHKDKIISETIYNELCGMEVKKSGRIEHSSNTHDDQVFSWLWALFIYYCGGDLMNDWGIVKRELRTDADLDEAVYEIEEEKSEIVTDIEVEQAESIEDQLDTLNSAPGRQSYEEWMQAEIAKDEEAVNRILKNKALAKTLDSRYRLMIDAQNENNSPIEKIPTDVFANFNSDADDEGNYNVLTGNLAKYW